MSELSVADIIERARSALGQSGEVWFETSAADGSVVFSGIGVTGRLVELNVSDLIGLCVTIEGRRVVRVEPELPRTEVNFPGTAEEVIQDFVAMAGEVRRGGGTVLRSQRTGEPIRLQLNDVHDKYELNAPILDRLGQPRRRFRRRVQTTQELRAIHVLEQCVKLLDAHTYGPTASADADVLADIDYVSTNLTVLLSRKRRGRATLEPRHLEEGHEILWRIASEAASPAHRTVAKQVHEGLRVAVAHLAVS